MKLLPATKSDIEVILNWIDSEEKAHVWGGLSLRYPFTLETVCEDIRLGEIDTFSLIDKDSNMVGIGQTVHVDNERIHLSRIMISPNHRGKGFGKTIVKLLIEKGIKLFGDKKISLKVFKDNSVAINLYKKLGFDFTDTIVSKDKNPNAAYMIKK